jgi:hypothetical protein
VEGGTFAGYTLVRLLGRGGTSSVFEAYEPSGTRRVALKIMAPGGDTARFHFQTEIGSTIQHPHLARVFSGGEWEGTPYLVGELYAGSLADCVEAYRDRPENVAAVMLEIAEAVACLHDHGILHRDLKPSNILLNRVDGRGHAYVADLGLAKQLGARPTETLAAWGTLENMAPERARSDARVSQAADIFSCGTILYELIVGRPIYEGTADEVWGKLQRCEPIRPPSARGVLVPKCLEDVCMECLEMRPALRYHSAHELSADLRAVTQHRSPRVSQRSFLHRCSRHCRRHPLLTLALAVTMLVAFAATGVATWTLREHERALQQQILQANRYAAQATAGQVLHVLRSMGDRLRECAMQPDIIAALQHGRRSLEPDPHAALRDCGLGTQFDSALLLDLEGHPVLRAPFMPPGYEQRSFLFRNYLMGARRLALRRQERGSRADATTEAVYIGRPHRSEGDGKVRLPIATPVFATSRDGHLLHVGYLMATLGTDSTIASLTFSDPNDPQRIGALLALRDRERNEAEQPMPKHFRVLIHEGLEHGTTRDIAGPPLTALHREIEVEDADQRHQFQLQSQTTLGSDDHRDPVPGFEGRWVAGFARVGQTDYVVVIQTRYEAIDIVKRWLLRSFGWSLAVLVIGLSMGFAAVRRHST